MQAGRKAMTRLTLPTEKEELALRAKFCIPIHRIIQDLRTFLHGGVSGYFLRPADLIGVTPGVNRLWHEAWMNTYGSGVDDRVRGVPQSRPVNFWRPLAQVSRPSPL